MFLFENKRTNVRTNVEITGIKWYNIFAWKHVGRVPMTGW